MSDSQKEIAMLVAMLRGQQLELQKLNRAILRKNAKIARLKELISSSEEGGGRRGGDEVASGIAPPVGSGAAEDAGSNPVSLGHADAGVASGPLTLKEAVEQAEPGDVIEVHHDGTAEITIDDVRRKNRERVKRWRDDLKSDPVRYEAYLAKERNRKSK